MYITLSNISYHYENSSFEVFENISLNLTEGWTGVVGNNGAGKSTLLQIICGVFRPVSGTIAPPYQGIYCAQSTEFPPQNREDFALDYSHDALFIRNQLEIEDEWFWRFDTLSKGERKRIQIACALHCNPAVLALDEPTNHLDAETRDVVLKTLKRYQGIGVIVSHDRMLLDALVYQCLFLKRKGGIVIPGTYTEGKNQQALYNKTASLERKNAHDELKRLTTEGHRRQEEASRSKSRRSGKGLDKHDSDGRARLRLAVVTGQDGKTGLLSSQMDKKISTAEARLKEAVIEKEYRKPLELRGVQAKRKVLIKKEAGILPLGDTGFLSYPEIYLTNTDRVGVRGRNGTGKSTFISFFVSDLLTDNQVVYLPQELSGKESREVLAKIKTLSSEELGKILSIVARLNSRPDQILSGESLSPGELKKVMLAYGLLKDPYLIIMDEPTNHLDIGSIEALQTFLADSKCALLLVSHDTVFHDVLTTTCWNFVQEEKGSDALAITLKVELL